MKMIDDAALTDTLIGLINQLGQSTGEPVPDFVEEAVCGTLNEFVLFLRKHRREQEDIRLPAMRRIAPEFAGDIDDLEKEHRSFDEQAADLVSHVSSGDEAAACEIARDCLAKLYDHVARERGLVDRILGALDESAIRELAALFFERRVSLVISELTSELRVGNACAQVLTAREGAVRVRLVPLDGASRYLYVLRSLLIKHLQERIPEIRRVEVEYEDSCR